MSKSKKPLLDLLHGKIPHQRPIWLMRQAGRYLPEYRDVRAKAGSFLDLCFNSELAAEVTLQPMRRYGFDAAILFADILLVPHALGQKLDFREGEGPVLEPVRDGESLKALQWDVEKLTPVFETLRLVKKELSKETTLIGFSGGLWTVACYVIEGRGKQGFKHALAMLDKDEPFVAALFHTLHLATLEYLARQIEAGAETIQIFDSWAGLLNDEQFRKWVIEPTKELVTALKSEYPSIPIIGFPRGVSLKNYQAFARETGVDMIGIDQDIDLDMARSELQSIIAVQGNLSPELLVEGGEAMFKAADTIMNKLGLNHAFNLGHGVMQQTPPEHVAQLVAHVRAWKK